MQDALVDSLAHGMLAMMQDVKALNAACFKNWIMPKANGFHAEVKAQLNDYRAKTEGQKGHAFGSTDLWVWRGVLKVAEKVLSNEKDQYAAQLKVIADHKPKCTPSGLRALVGHAKMTECNVEPGSSDPPQIRIELGCNVKMEEVVDAVGNAIMEAGGNEVTGKPPKGKWERNIVALLKKMGSWSEPGE